MFEIMRFNCGQIIYNSCCKSDLVLKYFNMCIDPVLIRSILKATTILSIEKCIEENKDSRQTDRCENQG